MNKTRTVRQYVFCIVTILATSGFCFAFSDLMGYRVIAFLLLLAVSVLAITFEILPVLLSAALSAFIWDFFFIPPRFTLQVHNTEDAILLGMYFIIAMINGVLTYKIRQVEKSARLKEERANSVKLYNTILNSLSHELRTPIAAIIGATDNLQWNGNLTAVQKDQLVQEISKASLRLNQQVENLLNISRLESGHIQPKSDWCDVVELVHDVVKRVEESNPDRKVNISMHPGFPLCLLDKGMLDQVLYNLLNNAALHTKPESRIDITGACRVDLLEFIIEDSGDGFPPEEIRDVFQKFSREQGPRSSGAGLGLSIVSGFTEALGGEVTVKNRPAGGAAFTITLPVRTSYIRTVHE
ncbi:MAG TPA: ATP-binding protein [Chitinophagaceae bacterium]|jgi:two-component system sensor histidine kinase KdpD|nr:ATP-binding protein [Chitinophagaceae bacterium]